MDFLLIAIIFLEINVNLFIDSTSVPLKTVDMTYTFDNSTLYWPTSQKFELIVEYNGTIEGGIWMQVENYFSNTHVGTHLDAPCHFAKGHWCVNQIPLEHLIAPAAVIDIMEQAGENRDYQVQVGDLTNWEHISGRSLDGTIVLIKSGWGRRWPDREAFTGTPGNDTTELHFPGMSKEACQWLVDNRNIYGLGTETLSLDPGSTNEAMAHRILLGANIFGLENVANMEVLPLSGATLHVMPMKIGNASGAPVRIIAIFPTSANF